MLLGLVFDYICCYITCYFGVLLIVYLITGDDLLFVDCLMVLRVLMVVVV